MFLEEYPHELTVERTTVEQSGSYPYTEVITTVTHDIQGFMDTPNTAEQLNYHNMQITLNRVLYVPFGTDIKRDDVFFYGDVKYEFSGDLEDQGGQNEVFSAPVKRVNP